MNPRIRLLLILLVAGVLISATLLLAARANENRLTDRVLQEVEPPATQTTKVHKKRILPPYGFSETTPQGSWAAIAEFDISQTDDPNTPVVIVGLASYGGKGQWAKQVMVDEVTVRNRTSNFVKSVKLGG
jgi:hypothetical protein